jgi:hypothetical protein
MNFNNATLLSVSRTSEFFSDTVRYRTVKNLAVEGLLLDLTNSDGVTGIITDLKSFELDSENWQPIVINGNDFGLGTITSISFANGNDVRTKTYTVNIDIPEEGDFSSLLGTDYGGLIFTYCKYLENFSESSTFDRNLNKDSYSQSINFSLRGPYSLDAVTAAKTMAENFFNNNNLINTVGNKYNDSQIKKYYDESYDSINNEYQFSRNFEINKDSNSVYSLSLSHSIDFDNAGVGKITEKAEYLGHTTTAFETANAQAKADIANAYSRCNTIFTNYLPTASNNTLATNPITKSWTAVPFDGTVSYTIVFSNTERIQSSYYWQYEITVDKSEAGQYTLTEQGSVVGFDHIIDVKYQNARNGWLAISPDISSRLSSYINGIKIVTQSTTFNKVAGKVDYTVKYTNSDSNLGDNINIRKALITISKTFNRNLASTFNIINYKEILQKQPNLLPNTISYTVNLNGKATTSLGTYLAAAKSYISPLNSSSEFLSDVSYTYNPFSRSFSLNASITSLP